MADLAVTAANVLPGSSAKKVDGVAGASITAGQVVYLDTATNTFKLADCNSATVAARTPVGVALHGSLTGQPLVVQTAGPITIGATLAIGGAYFLSGTPGGIRPAADNVTGDYPASLGMPLSTTVLSLNIQAPGVIM